VHPEGLGKLKKLIHRIGSRTRDLPACSVMPQPLYYRVPLVAADIVTFIWFLTSAQTDTNIIHRMTLHITGVIQYQINSGYLSTHVNQTGQNISTTICVLDLNRIIVLSKAFIV
jgi:hypothetical protein